MQSLNRRPKNVLADGVTNHYAPRIGVRLFSLSARACGDRRPYSLKCESSPDRGQSDWRGMGYHAMPLSTYVDLAKFILAVRKQRFFSEKGSFLVARRPLWQSPGYL